MLHWQLLHSLILREGQGTHVRISGPSLSFNRRPRGESSLGIDGCGEDRHRFHLVVPPGLGVNEPVVQLLRFSRVAPRRCIVPVVQQHFVHEDVLPRRPYAPCHAALPVADVLAR